MRAHNGSKNRSYHLCHVPICNNRVQNIIEMGDTETCLLKIDWEEQGFMQHALFRAEFNNYQHFVTHVARVNF